MKRPSMKKLSIPLFTITVAMACSPGTARAGGLSLYEVGSPDVGLAAAGYAARAQDASTLLTNPAGMTRLQDSEFLFGGQMLYGDLGFTQNSNTTVPGGGGDVNNAIGWVPAGSMFYVHNASPDLKYGFGVFSNFGLAMDYGDNWVGRYTVQRATLMGLSFMPAVAYRVNDQVSIGAGLNAMYGIFKTDVAINNILPGLPDGQLKLSDNEWGFGGNFGILYEASKATRFGVTYSSAVKLDFKAQPQFTNLGPGLSAALNAAGLLNGQIGLNMKVPQAVMTSVYHQLDDRWAILGSVGWQQWSHFGRVGIEIDSNNPTSLTVNAKYNDTWHGAVGAQYRPSSLWMWSFGVAYDTSAVDDENRTTTFPVGDSWRLGAGGTYAMSKQMDINFDYELAWGGTLPLDQTGGPLTGRLAGEYQDTSISFFVVNFRWKL